MPSSVANADNASRPELYSAADGSAGAHVPSSRRLATDHSTPTTGTSPDSTRAPSVAARHLQASETSVAVPADDGACGDGIEHALLSSPLSPAPPSSSPPPPAWFRWVALIVICFMCVGQYFIFDFPGAVGVGAVGTIQARFAARGKPYDQVMNQALYSVYSWPNTVLALVGGILIDRVLGLRRASIVFVSFVCCGAWLFFLGVQFTQYPLMMVARFVFGLGSESLAVAQSCFVARWFADGKGLAFAFGVTITACRIASTANFYFSPRIATHAGVNVTTMVGGFVTLLSLASTLGLSLLDRHGERIGAVAVWRKDTTQKIDIKGIFRLPASCLVLGGVTGFVYGSMYPFIGIARDFFTRMYGMSGTDAATVVSVYQLVSALGCPLFGAVVDRTGFASQWLTTACVGFTVIHTVFATTTAVPPIAMMVIMALVYSILIASLWTSAPKTVEAARVGLVYGAMTSLQNTFLASVPLATGSMLDAFEAAPPANATATGHGNHTHTGLAHPLAFASQPSGHAHAPVRRHHGHPGHAHATTTRQGYIYVEYLLLGLAAVSTLLALCLWALQVRTRGALYVGAAEAQQRVARLNEEYEERKERAAAVANDDDEDDDYAKGRAVVTLDAGLQPRASTQKT